MVFIGFLNATFMSVYLFIFAVIRILIWAARCTNCTFQAHGAEVLSGPDLLSEFVLGFHDSYVLMGLYLPCSNTCFYFTLLPVLYNLLTLVFSLAFPICKYAIVDSVNDLCQTPACYLTEREDAYCICTCSFQLTVKLPSLAVRPWNSAHSSTNWKWKELQIFIARHSQGCILSLQPFKQQLPQ